MNPKRYAMKASMLSNKKIAETKNASTKSCFEENMVEETVKIKNDTIAVHHTFRNKIPLASITLKKNKAAKKGAMPMINPRTGSLLL